MMAKMAVTNGWQLSGLCYHHLLTEPKISWTANVKFRGLSRGFSGKPLFSTTPGAKLYNFPTPSLGGNMPKKKGAQVFSPNISSPSTIVEFLDAYDDEYNGVIIDPEFLPSSANAFASALRGSLSHWKLKGKRGIWLKILQEQADLVPIAIQEGFNYHHAEPGYVMLTYWIPNEPCLLPDSPSHQIGVGGFVINEKREILVVKEKCPCSCSDIWKLPTGYVNKITIYSSNKKIMVDSSLFIFFQSEELFSGAIREVKEETGIDTAFLEVIAFRHAHLVAFEKSDLLFVCMLKPLSFDITIEEKEIQAAKWMPLDEFMGQTFYEEDDMSKKLIDICVAACENRYNGFNAHHLTSKLDGKLSYLYYDDLKEI
ncbi:hypothetical protein HHK36_025571 [Tetracentron sinense]|uniref:Nudix hydrolase domain-containing protein n=1 Tax=Tetracentron sinense TaxID=13715 RepID=A0A834YLJ1_TETSI|nr:hypothetical protein HHK36_025571 [Tetracentron sinense]